MALSNPEERRESYRKRHDEIDEKVDYKNLKDVTGEIQAMSDHLIHGEEGTFLADKNLAKLPDNITLFQTRGGD